MRYISQSNIIDKKALDPPPLSANKIIPQTSTFGKRIKFPNLRGGGDVYYSCVILND